jgi:ribosomal protein S18 acetylase RimI-like enzyme
LKKADIVDFRTLDRQGVMEFLKEQMPRSVYLIGDMVSGHENLTMFAALEESKIKGIILYYWGVPGTGIIWILGNHGTVDRFIDGLEEGTFAILVPIESGKKLKEKFGDIRSYPEYIMKLTEQAADNHGGDDVRILGSDDLAQWGYLKTERKTFSREENDQFLKNLQEQTCFGLFVGGTLVSGAMIETGTSEIAVIGSVKTLSNHRNKGYATALMASVARYCRNNGQEVYLFVRKDNLPAIRSYRKVGFTIVDEILISYLGMEI